MRFPDFLRPGNAAQRIEMHFSMRLLTSAALAYFKETGLSTIHLTVVGLEDWTCWFSQFQRLAHTAGAPKCSSVVAKAVETLYEL